MSIQTTAVPAPEALPADVLADLEAVAAAVAAGMKIDPEIVRRVRERAEKVRQEVYEAHGLLDIGVPAIRELREGQ
jgi:hypothetical protein